MKLFNYNQFLGTPINENLDKAKKLLKDSAILSIAAKELDFVDKKLSNMFEDKEKRVFTLKDFSAEQQAQLKLKMREVKLSDEQIRNLERDPNFIKIREILMPSSIRLKDGEKRAAGTVDSPGYIYPFTYFFYVEMTTLEELQSMYNKILEYRDLLPKLPKKFDANFIDVNIKNNAEVLVDGLDSLEDHKKVKKTIDKLTPELKKDYADSPDVIKEQFAEVARAFDQLGIDAQGKVNEVDRDKLQKLFFGEVKLVDGVKRYVGQLKRYKNIREFIKSAQNYLKDSQNSDTVAFYDKINQANEKYGALGADVCLDESGILVIEVKSFQANQMLNGHTRHCIKDYMSQWESYITNRNNKQYYIYNFNIPQYDNKSVIGITIQSGTNKTYACHIKDDGAFTSQIQSQLKSWEKEYKIETDIYKDVLLPLSQEELAKRERSKVANREIVKKGLTIEQIVKYVKEDGADINKDNGICLQNAVEENNLEKTKIILGFGASPNLKTGSDAVISKAKDLNMIKLLVDHGSALTSEAFNSIANDVEAVKYCIDGGLDVNFNSSLPMRRSCKGSWVDRDHPGEGYFEIFKLLIKSGAKIVDDRGRNMIVKWASDYNRIEFIDYMIDNCDLRVGFKAAAEWMPHNRKVSDVDKKNVIAYLNDKAKKYES